MLNTKTLGEVAAGCDDMHGTLKHSDLWVDHLIIISRWNV